jgi:hypothetical protein
MSTTLPSAGWVSLLAEDPRPWLLAADEAPARWLALRYLVGAAPAAGDTCAAAAARQAALADPGLLAIADDLPDWEVEPTTGGHNSPSFAPNRLSLLWWMGLRGGEAASVERLLDQMLAHQSADGRFETLGRWRGSPSPIWGALLCDNHAIVDGLVRFGRGADPRVMLAIERMLADVAATGQGQGWPCVADATTGFRGPGRKSDVCPQVTVEALRALYYAGRGSAEAALGGARTLCDLWLERGLHKPYMFGHGRQFKRVKWPPFWYDAFAVSDALSLYPVIWSGPAARPEHQRAVAELAACLVAYNFGPDGRVVPRSCYRGFEQYSWGQKKQSSPLATAMLCVVLQRLDVLSPAIAAVDVRALGSSKGGSGMAVPPS